MKELTLKELQSEELKILKDVHEYCIKNNIRYSLYGGTLIGALRHKGFIPWDDDIDIIMPRPDYIRFCCGYKSSIYKIADLTYSKDYMLGFARVYDDTSTIVESRLPWLKKNTGVWIDIFPADGMPEKEDEIKTIYQKAIRLRSKLLLARGAHAKFSAYDTFSGKMKLLIKKIITFNGVFARKYVCQLDKVIQSYDFSSSPMWGSLSNLRGMFEHKYHSITTFQTCKLVDFEDMKACIMNGSDEILRERYGNYMQMPPESDRVPKQWYIHFYWKE